MESPPGARAVVDGREVDYFCGCGYFGLQGHPDVVAAACEAARRFGIASATVRSGYGDNPALLDVESRAARFFDQESAVYYASGYLGAAILLGGLREEYDVVFVDRDSHYSVQDGVRLAGKRMVAFAHRDADDLERKLAEHVKPRERPAVACDGVFPVSGELSPVADYVEVLDKYDGPTVYVDDAHATGVIGEKGRGCFEQLGVSGPGLFASGTMSKALGGHGGIIAGSTDLVERLKRESNILSGSSAPATPAAAATAKALEILAGNPQLRVRLWENARYAKDGLRSLGFEMNDTPVPIICLSSKRVDLERLPGRLLERGLAVSPFFAGRESYSSVPAQGAVRIAVFSSHTREQIDRLVAEIGAAV